MSEIKKRWVDAGEQFAELGDKFQEQYRGRTGDEIDDRLHNAIEGVMHAVEEVLIAAGHALGDTTLRADAQRGLSALHEALLVTFTDSTEVIEEAASNLRLGLAQLSDYQEVVDQL